MSRSQGRRNKDLTISLDKAGSIFGGVEAMDVGTTYTKIFQRRDAAQMERVAISSRCTETRFEQEPINPGTNETTWYCRG